MSISLRKVGLCLTALVAAAPMASYAEDMPALDRCVDIFVKEVVPANRTADIRRDDIKASVRQVSATRSRATLIAKGERDSKVLGRAACVLDRNGTLVALYLYDAKPNPLGTGRPKVVALNERVNADVRTASASDTKPF